jgi:hypothetical protein
MSLSLRGFTIAFLLAATAPAAAQPLVAPTHVDLRFGWKPGMEMSVTATRTRLRAADERTTRASSSRYTVRVEAEGENLRIRFTNPEFDTTNDAGSMTPSEQAKIMEKIADLMPDFVVTREGDFVGIHDLPAFQKKLWDFLIDIMPPNVDAAVVTQMQSLLTSEAFLNSRASEEWNAIVGAWVGSDFEIGVPVEHSRAEPVAIFPGSEIRMNYAFSADRVLPCKRANAERRCAELSMRSVADPEATRKVIDSFLAQLAPGQVPEMPVFRTLAIENVLRVRTEPDGLIPHAYSLTKSIRGTVAAPDGEQVVEQIDTTEVRYAYP